MVRVLHVRIASDAICLVFVAMLRVMVVKWRQWRSSHDGVATHLFVLMRPAPFEPHFTPDVGASDVAVFMRLLVALLTSGGVLLLPACTCHGLSSRRPECCAPRLCWH